MGIQKERTTSKENKKTERRSQYPNWKNHASNQKPTHASMIAKRSCYEQSKECVVMHRGRETNHEVMRGPEKGKEEEKDNKRQGAIPKSSDQTGTWLPKIVEGR
jgi:hypothetical protein